MKQKWKKILSLVMALSLILSLMVPVYAAETPTETAEPTTSTVQYTDVAGHWAEDAILEWSEYGIIAGDGTGKFNPDANITRAELAKILAETLKLEVTAENQFNDLPSDAWYTPYILKCVAAGIMNGRGNGLVSPSDPVTRQETCKMVAVALGLELATGRTDFKDDASIADWAMPYVSAMRSAGYIQGVGGGLFAPETSLTRASAVTMLDNAVVTYITQDNTTVTGVQDGIVIIAANGVTLKDATVNGNLIICGDNVAVEKTTVNGNVLVNGDQAVLKNSTVKGDLNVANSVKKVTLNSTSVTGKTTGNTSAVVTTPSGGSSSGGSDDGDSSDSQVPETGHTNAYDLANPYVGVNVGLFHNVPITVDEDTTGVASYYLPEGMDPWAPAVIVLTPDNTTARAFSGSETGKAWQAVADENKIAVAFLEPQDGKTWNLDLSEDGRDDAAVLNQLYLTMRQKGLSLKGAFSMDKSHTALVGYEEGGAAALVFGGRWASDFSSICAVDATAASAEALKTIGEEYVMPFPGDTTQGIEEEAIAAKTVDTPVWFVNSDAEGANKAALDFYVTAANATKGTANSYAESVYNTGREGSDVEIWVSKNTQTPATIWEQFSGTFKRFMAMQLPGRVTKAQDFTEKGFSIHEETINGEVRRWMTYVPSSYDGTSEVPLVLVMHGYTASMYAIAEESRWYDVAEENGFIVVFAQGLVRPADAMGNIPTAMWLAGAFGSMAGEDTDPEADLKFLDTLLDKMESDYKIDTSRVYATGHSNGSLMTWAMGSKFADRFAAIAPVGYMSEPMDGLEEGTILPTWSFLGEYDSAGDPTLVEGGATVKSLQAWNKQNGTNEDKVSTSKQYDGGFVTRTFSNEDGVPLVKFTEVKDTPHVYLQEESVTIWNEFFSKYSRGEDGTVYYQASAESEPEAVKASEYKASTGWFAPAEKVEYTYDPENPYDAVITGKCDGVMITAGDDMASATVYIPEGAQPYCPVVLVLTPDGMTAAEFAETETGKAWMAAADAQEAGVAYDQKFVVAFMGPEAGESWNLTLDENGRDDASLVNSLYTTIRSRSLSQRHPAGVNRGWIALVGYEEGGAAALLFGARHAANFSSICAVDATEVPAASLSAVGELYVAPFTGDGSTDGVQELQLKAKDVATSVWLIDSGADSTNAHVVNYFKTADDITAAGAPGEDPFDTQYVNAENPAKMVVVTDSEGQSVAPDAIWDNFTGQIKRLRALEKGGRIAFAQDYTEEGFTVTQETVNGEVRRWITYVPTTYDGSTKVPLVMVLHGYGATMTGIAEESRWYDLAEENGFIVVFANALNTDGASRGNVPAPTWRSESAVNADNVDVQFLNGLLDRMEEDYNIDTGREYITGHSNGSMMTWTMAINATDRFAAIGPCGYMVPYEGELSAETPIAIWGFLGEYDSVGSAKLIEGNNTVKSLQAWNKHNGIDETTAKAEKESVMYADSFATETFSTADGVPLVKFTEVADTPHVYLQEEATHLWEFFSHYYRDEEGNLYYQADDDTPAVKVTLGEYKADDGWYTAE